MDLSYATNLTHLSLVEEDLWTFSPLINTLRVQWQRNGPVHTVTKRVRYPRRALWPQCSWAHGARFERPLEGRNLGDSCLPFQGTKSGTYVSLFSYFLSNNTLKYLHTNIQKHTYTTKPPNTPEWFTHSSVLYVFWHTEFQLHKTVKQKNILKISFKGRRS